MYIICIFVLIDKLHNFPLFYFNFRKVKEIGLEATIDQLRTELEVTRRKVILALFEIKNVLL